MENGDGGRDAFLMHIVDQKPKFFIKIDEHKKKFFHHAKTIHTKVNFPFFFLYLS